MRFLILILSLFLFVACHNKSDLKKIEELKKENTQLKEKFSVVNVTKLYESAKKDIIDSILFGITTRDKMLDDSWDIYYAYNKSTRKTIKLNQEKYTSDIHFVIDSDKHFDSIIYTIPSKNRIVLDYNLDYTSKIKTKNNFSFSPTDTGWYFYKGGLQLKNRRTGMLSIYPITDSFYVYK